ncbi:hypothetical protein STRATTON_30 [Erwinia phage vB_EamM_Stratton]|uniref:Uncharacterized protein n=2 Tax=Erskinevirus EaH2 TaxID=2169883 RepID=A0A1B2IGU4_9CAUD|nr:hypothetical protein G173_gp197 [Erwinia phage phiEaH2]AFQ96742.1 hypothetical protein [Erwinia phage phiEaH2]ANZ50455.1 hypothetical protein STRATTON_30 [Erwinia phage vB_EamM_Stratton]
MKLYLDVAEIFDFEELMARAHLANENEVEPAIAYLFLTKYAEETVRSIAKRAGEGENFLTFISPEPHLIVTQLAQMWGREKVVPLLMSHMSWKINEDVQFTRILNTVERLWKEVGLPRDEAAKRTKVSLLMKEIGSATICVEC